MILRLEMPTIDPSLRGGQVESWTRNVGDPISFGDQVCIVALDDFAVLRRTARATLLAGRRRQKLKSDLEVRESKVLIRFAITSSDTGVLRKIIKDQGDRIAIDDLMAIVTTEDGEPVGQAHEWADAPKMRLATNPVDGDQDFKERN